MQVFYDITKTEYNKGVALGFFDGVHLGHKAVISQCVKTSLQNDCTPCVLTFRRSPSAVLSKKPTPMLTDNDKKLSLIKACSVDSVYCIDFNDIKDLTAEQFVRDILLGSLSAKYVFCGYNYHFGAGGTADANTLCSLCEKYGIQTYTCDRIVRDGTVISSTAIRRSIMNGDIEQANLMLGYRFSIGGEIVGGNHIGTKLSTPTINQPIQNGLILPRFGVYATRVTIGDTTYKGATNIGIHPTVGSCEPVCETYLFDYNGADLYSKYADTVLCKFIRPEQKFDSMQALSAQISKDKQDILSYFDKIG